MKTWHGGATLLACDELREKIRGKRIALMMNTTALDNEGSLLIDKIVDEKWSEVVFLLGMEHGVRGNLYAAESGIPACDARTGLPVVNLYDYPRLQPPIDRLMEVDAVVFCAQDVGVRHWTYTPWLMLLMDSAAVAGCEVIVLDRPNPIRGDIVEGAPARPPYVGTHLLSGFEYPLRHGMTVGELALMYNDLKHVGANLSVLKMRDWKRDMWYEETGLPWVPASPNMPTVDTALYFAATGLMQGADFSLGMGTATPFQYVGDAGLDADLLARELNALELAGVYFLPKYYMASTYRDIYRGERHKPTLCNGVLILINDRNAWRPVETQLYIMDTLCRLFGEKIHMEHHGSARIRMCTDEICDAIIRGESLLPIIEHWREEARCFEKARMPYLLY
ncbi:MAG: DUF1343 domain-containing protein [Ruminococcaceae bacterium]|nr:DUF1343 domain-containing protein [Oscillospiraceae bacterium]